MANQDPALEADVVMRGGITSGIIVSAHFSAHQDEHRRPAGLDGIEGAVFERQLVFWCARSPKLKGSRSSMLASVARWGSSVSTWHSQA
jgi:hypothetical protein